jgi:high-affinity iron transporter
MVLSVAPVVDVQPIGSQSAGGSAAGSGASETGEAGLEAWLEAIEAGIGALLVNESASATEWTNVVLRLYLDHYEPLEAWYGPGAPHGAGGLSEVVTAGEARFHVLLQARDVESLRANGRSLLDELTAIRAAAHAANVPLIPEAAPPVMEVVGVTITPEQAKTSEVRGMLETLSAARAAYDAGDARAALAHVEAMYLQGFEPLEARLPGAIVREVESLIHLTLRPQLARGAGEGEVVATFDAVNAGLARADEALADGGSFWFTAVNSFAIIVREGLEAVLLIAAMLAYLSGIGAEKKARQRIWIGVAAGLVATAGTWVLASTLIPVSGAGRELMEGITALLAVAVLIYVSNWLFQKTYVHDWKTYLRERMGRAVTTGSALAMAGLAFAAIYREGFETVLFYQALLLDDGSAAVAAGFAPGLVLILVVGGAILRMGVKLPLKQVFAITNAILVWLAFVFLGKGLYNLQEAGLFAPRPIGWMPDHEALRQLFGFYPLAETVTAQVLFVTLITATWLVYRRRMARSAAAVAAGS